MKAQPPEITRKKVLTGFCYTLVFDTIIAVLLTSVGFGGGFLINLAFSQCIGLTICSLCFVGLYVLKPASPIGRLAVVMVSLIVGSLIGGLSGAMVSGIGPSTMFQEKGADIITTVFFGVLFGSVISYFFLSREKIVATDAMLQKEKIARLAIEKEAVENDLRLLQAQIEPHFLFNTLSNVLSLMDTDLEKGKDMLKDLIHYLRTSIFRTRELHSTIGREMEMIRAYMNIFKVRMGKRLQYRIDVPDGMKDIPFPPMLIQPLVENAIKHGLEPKVEGGDISVRVEERGDLLRIEVRDTGLGLGPDMGEGMGLSNIRKRLDALYEGKAQLLLKENPPSGLRAIIEAPRDRDQGNHC